MVSMGLKWFSTEELNYETVTQSPLKSSSESATEASFYFLLFIAEEEKEKKRKEEQIGGTGFRIRDHFIYNIATYLFFFSFFFIKK